MKNLEKFKLAIFVRDQEYHDTLNSYLYRSLNKIDNLSITIIANCHIETHHKFININDYLSLFDNYKNEDEFYSDLNSEIWKKKKVYDADPLYVAKVKNYSWKDQYKYVESCRKIYQEENFDLIFMGAAAYLIWTVPQLVALEMNILSYKLHIFDYINPYFKGIRIWFCTDPFWNLNVNSKYDFNWEKESTQDHIEALRKSLIEDNFNLDQNAILEREDFTPKKPKNIVKNILKILIKFDYLSKLRLRAFLESRRNKKIYIEPENLPDKFLFYPLNMPYDEQLTLRAPGFKDNYKNIEYILENLPHGCDLVIKEHPVNPGMMEYKKLVNITNNYSNFHVIPPWVPLRDILFQSMGLITINSTAGLESLIVNKNVLALGMGYYKDLESVYTIEKKPIKEILNEMSLEISNVDINEIDLLLKRILNQTYPRPNSFPDKTLHADETMSDAIYFKLKQIIELKN